MPGGPKRGAPPSAEAPPRPEWPVRPWAASPELIEVPWAPDGGALWPVEVAARREGDRTLVRVSPSVRITVDLEALLREVLAAVDMLALAFGGGVVVELPGGGGVAVPRWFVAALERHGGKVAFYDPGAAGGAA